MGIWVTRHHHNQGETTMTNLDPQTTADFWDAYVSAADAGAHVRDRVRVRVRVRVRQSLRRATFAQRRADQPPV
jgi:hypothetical protein